MVDVEETSTSLLFTPTLGDGDLPVTGSGEVWGGQYSPFKRSSRGVQEEVRGPEGRLGTDIEPGAWEEKGFFSADLLYARH